LQCSAIFGAVLRVFGSDVGYYNTNALIDAAIARRCKLEKRGGGDEPLRRLRLASI